MKIRILIVDDQPMIRRALALLLENEDSIEVIGDADSGEAALPLVADLRPNVVLMDILMPGMGGVEATREICQSFDETQVLILSIDDDDEYVIQALRYGASGYILKTTPPEELAFAIQAVYRGYTHLGPGIGKKIIAQIPDPIFNSSESWDKLTPREQEIVKLIAT
ncbi:MAG: response regulator, partial [Halothece sp.]